MIYCGNWHYATMIVDRAGLVSIPEHSFNSSSQTVIMCEGC